MDSKTWWMIEYPTEGKGYQFTPWYRHLNLAFSCLTEPSFIRKVWIKDLDKGVICIAETQEDVQRLFK